MNIPTGVVTFLFTDIEGSTKLAQLDNVSYFSALEKHNEILNEAIDAANGFVFKVIGDAFCTAFSSVQEAIKAAVNSQKKLNSTDWNNTIIKVRMGIHTGKAEWNGNDYMGYVTLARSQRVMSAAYGGQILISEDAFVSKGDDISEIYLFRDLGERRLKDLIQPVKLYQIISDDIQTNFPSLMTLDARPNNLPVQLTSFIGREKDITEIKKLLSGTRLISLLGPGGTGKTRISLQVAADLIDDFENGVWFIELAPLSDPAFITTTIARTLGINEHPGQESEMSLINYLKYKELLIIMDNCEHLIGACAEIAEKILQSCPKIKIITTSREALKCSGELTYKLLSLTHPDIKQVISPLQLSQYEAVRLFIERALSINQKFRVNNENAPALAQICYHLDGIPLAIELASARIKLMSVEKICEKLDDRFRLLTGGKRTALPRQQTLKAMIDWSYDLLTEKEKILFQRLSVFTGGWTFEAAEEICSDEKIDLNEILDIHSNLIDKSLINSTEISGAIRFNLLETIKSYANEKLGEDADFKKRHFDYYSRIANYEKMKLNGINQLQWVNLAESELDNLRAAIQWASENEKEEACNLIYVFSEFWILRGYLMEGMQMSKKYLNSEFSIDEIYTAKVLFVAGLLSQHIGNSTEAEKYINESLSIFIKKDSKEEVAKCLNVLGIISYTFKTNFTEALEFHNKAISIFRECDNKSGIAQTLYYMSSPLHVLGEEELAFQHKEEALNIYKDLDDITMVCLIQAGLGVNELKRKNIHIAKTYSEDSLSIAYEFENKYLISINLINLGCIYIELKEFERAEDMLEESLIIIKDCGYISNLLVVYMYLGNVAKEKGNHEKAILYHKKSILTGFEASINFFLSTNIYEIGISYYKMKEHEKSLEYFLYLNKVILEKNDPLGIHNLSNAENYRNMLREIIGNDKYEKISNEMMKLNREEIVKSVLSDFQNTD